MSHAITPLKPRPHDGSVFDTPTATAREVFTKAGFEKAYLMPEFGGVMLDGLWQPNIWSLTQLVGERAEVYAMYFKTKHSIRRYRGGVPRIVADKVAQLQQVRAFERYEVWFTGRFAVVVGINSSQNHFDYIIECWSTEATQRELPPYAFLLAQKRRVDTWRFVLRLIAVAGLVLAVIGAIKSLQTDSIAWRAIAEAAGSCAVFSFIGSMVLRR